MDSLIVLSMPKYPSELTAGLNSRSILTVTSLSVVTLSLFTSFPSLSNILIMGIAMDLSAMGERISNTVPSSVILWISLT